MTGKILFFQWNAFMQKGIEHAFEKMQLKYDTYYYCFSDWDKDDAFVNQFKKFLQGGSSLEHQSAVCRYSCVFSVNFSPLISQVCEVLQIPYRAWVYDAPIHIRRIQTLANQCNEVYFFDKVQVENYKQAGFTTVYHMPLAVDPEVFENGDTDTDTDINQDTNLAADVDFECELSFVGSLYRSDFNYLCGPLDLYWRGYLDGMVRTQQHVQGGYLLDELITEQMMEQLNELYHRASGGTVTVLKEELEYALACEVTGRDRCMALQLLQNRCQVKLYSNDTDERLLQVKAMGYADYYSQMPKVFKNSKINLNITLRIIQSGIPLRVLDILGCGGFLITNYQPEILEYFEPGIDLVIYEDIPDLIAKVQYYLAHEKERCQIARNGQEKVRQLFSFEDRISKIFHDLV